jgi:HD-like signal output (HDOD) protein
MPPITITPTKSATSSTVQHHLQQAGEQLEQAETSRVAAAQSHSSGDTQGAQQQAQAASAHTALALQHMSQAKQLAAPGSVAVLGSTTEQVLDTVEDGNA